MSAAPEAVARVSRAHRMGALSSPVWGMELYVLVMVKVVPFRLMLLV